MVKITKYSDWEKISPDLETEDWFPTTGRICWTEPPEAIEADKSVPRPEFHAEQNESFWCWRFKTGRIPEVEDITIRSRGLPWGLWNFQEKRKQEANIQTCALDTVAVAARFMGVHSTYAAAIKGQSFENYLERLFRDRGIVRANQPGIRIPTRDAQGLPLNPSNISLPFAIFCGLDWEGMTKRALLQAKTALYARCVRAGLFDTTGGNAVEVWNNCVEGDMQVTTLTFDGYYCRDCKRFFGYQNPSSRIWNNDSNYASTLNENYLTKRQSLIVRLTAGATEAQKERLLLDLSIESAMNNYGGQRNPALGGANGKPTNGVFCPECETAFINDATIIRRMPEFLAISTEVEMYWIDPVRNPKKPDGSETIEATRKRVKYGQGKGAAQYADCTPEDRLEEPTATGKFRQPIPQELELPITFSVPCDNGFDRDSPNPAFYPIVEHDYFWRGGIYYQPSLTSIGLGHYRAYFHSGEYDEEDIYNQDLTMMYDGFQPDEWTNLNPAHHYGRAPPKGSNKRAAEEEASGSPASKKSRGKGEKPSKFIHNKQPRKGIKVQRQLVFTGDGVIIDGCCRRQGRRVGLPYRQYPILFFYEHDHNSWKKQPKPSEIDDMYTCCQRGGTTGQAGTGGPSGSGSGGPSGSGSGGGPSGIGSGGPSGSGGGGSGSGNGGGGLGSGSGNGGGLSGSTGGPSGSGDGQGDQQGDQSGSGTTGAHGSTAESGNQGHCNVMSFDPISEQQQQGLDLTGWLPGAKPLSALQDIDEVEPGTVPRSGGILHMPGTTKSLSPAAGLEKTPTSKGRFGGIFDSSSGSPTSFSPVATPWPPRNAGSPSAQPSAVTSLTPCKQFPPRSSSHSAKIDILKGLGSDIFNIVAEDEANYEDQPSVQSSDQSSDQLRDGKPQGELQGDAMDAAPDVFKGLHQPSFISVPESEEGLLKQSSKQDRSASSINASTSTSASVGNNKSGPESLSSPTNVSRSFTSSPPIISRPLSAGQLFPGPPIAKMPTKTPTKTPTAKSPIPWSSPTAFTWGNLPSATRSSQPGIASPLSHVVVFDNFATSSSDNTNDSPLNASVKTPSKPPLAKSPLNLQPKHPLKSHLPHPPRPQNPTPKTALTKTAGNQLHATVESSPLGYPIQSEHPWPPAPLQPSSERPPLDPSPVALPPSETPLPPEKTPLDGHIPGHGPSKIHPTSSAVSPKAVDRKEQARKEEARKENERKEEARKENEKQKREQDRIERERVERRTIEHQRTQVWRALHGETVRADEMYLGPTRATPQTATRAGNMYSIIEMQTGGPIGEQNPERNDSKEEDDGSGSEYENESGSGEEVEEAEEEESSSPEIVRFLPPEQGDFQPLPSS